MYEMTFDDGFASRSLHLLRLSKCDCVRDVFWVPRFAERKSFSLE